MATDDMRTLTIGRLARAAGVGVETVRYYQSRALLPVPARAGGFRHYPEALVDRIRFIKRAQELGFTLDEIAGLLRLHDGTDRASIRSITGARLAQIASRIADLNRMRRTLEHLLHACEHSGQDVACPIIDALVGTARPPGPAPSGGRLTPANRRPARRIDGPPPRRG